MISNRNAKNKIYCPTQRIILSMRTKDSKIFFTRPFIFFFRAFPTYEAENLVNSPKVEISYKILPPVSADPNSLEITNADVVFCWWSRRVPSSSRRRTPSPRGQRCT